jgi:DNA-binding CsgD family transcriptional regulator
MAVVRAESVRDELLRLVHRGLDVRGFALAAAHALRRAVPFDGICVVMMDPATLLPVGHVIENGLPESTMARYMEIEIREADVNKFTDLARAGGRAASLSAVTGGVLDRSPRHRELRRPSGFGDELRAALVDESRTWGAIVLLREERTANFTPAEERVVGSLSALLADGLRRAMLLTELTAGDGADEPGPGLLVLADDGTILSANATAELWLDELGAEPGASLPLVIRTVALRARTGAADAIARARVRTPAGRWLVVRGSLLGDGAAVILEEARSPELAPLIADAYALTPRERSVTQLVAQGLSTSAIASRLFMSPYTVQDHLKSIFDKVDVSSRGELVARLFFEHYVPRLA